jgi:hypothetical protein
MMAGVASSAVSFYRSFLMSRGQFDPREFGVDMDRADFMDQMAIEFNEAYKGSWSVDEMLLHPREALRLCDEIRRKHGYHDVPDDIILRSMMTRRKNPNA